MDSGRDVRTVEQACVERQAPGNESNDQATTCKETSWGTSRKASAALTDTLQLLGKPAERVLLAVHDCCVNARAAGSAEGVTGAAIAVPRHR